MARGEGFLRTWISKVFAIGISCALLMVGAFHYGRRTIPRLEIIRRYHLMMYESPAMWNLQWLGIPTVQNPNDVWVTQEIIAEVKPDFIIETGTAQGGSAAIWAMIQREVNPKGRVITIDIENAAARDRMSEKLLEHIDFIVGSSVDPDIVARISERVKGARTLVILDSDHHRSHVLKELEAYASVVSVGSYVIVQDTNIGGHPAVCPAYPGAGPMEAVAEFLAAHPQFQADVSREKLLFTMHPGGYLKRIR
jgi:cephalosporin hydroxylase